MTDEYTPAVGDEHWMDRWRSPSGDEVLLFTTNRTAYVRAGLTLIQSKAYDYRTQQGADAAAARNRGTRADTGSTYPAVFPAPSASATAPAQAPALQPLAPPGTPSLQSA